MLRRRDEGKGKILFIDVDSPDYKTEDNAGISYEQVLCQRPHSLQCTLSRLVITLNVHQPPLAHRFNRCGSWQAMENIHGILPDQTVVTNVEVSMLQPLPNLQCIILQAKLQIQRHYCLMPEFKQSRHWCCRCSGGCMMRLDWDGCTPSPRFSPLVGWQIGGSCFSFVRIHTSMHPFRRTVIRQSCKW